jgi:DnaJ-class molecular chaperone
MLDYYKLLNIERNANVSDIKKAYRIAAMFWHPDKNKSPLAHQKFIDITEAYSILLDPYKRKIYDDLFEEEKNIVLRNNKTNPNNEQGNKHRKVYEEWIKEERIKAEKLSKLYTDKILTEGFHFIDQFGWIILIIVMSIFMLVIFSIK